MKSIFIVLMLGSIGWMGQVATGRVVPASSGECCCEEVCTLPQLAKRTTSCGCPLTTTCGPTVSLLPLAMLGEGGIVLHGPSGHRTPWQLVQMAARSRFEVPPLPPPESLS